MARILLIETSTSLLSAAVAEDGLVTGQIESDEPRMHAALTAVFVDRLLKDKGLKMKDFDAVSVSKGPGSYTGLRVGVSTAKGLCFGAGIPLIGIGTLDILVSQAALQGQHPGDFRYIVPMIDARRLEVYSAVFSPEGKQLTETASVIITPDSYADILSEGPVLVIGDGAEKCREMLPGGVFVPCCPRAAAMAPLAEAAFHEKRFEDLAYFEPFYLKDFVATVSRKKLF